MISGSGILDSTVKELPVNILLAISGSCKKSSIIFSSIISDSVGIFSSIAGPNIAHLITSGIFSTIGSLISSSDLSFVFLDFFLRFFLLASELSLLGSAPVIESMLASCSRKALDFSSTFSNISSTGSAICGLERDTSYWSS